MQTVRPSSDTVSFVASDLGLYCLPRSARHTSVCQEALGIQVFAKKRYAYKCLPRSARHTSVCQRALGIQVFAKKR